MSIVPPLVVSRELLSTVAKLYVYDRSPCSVTVAPRIAYIIPLFVIVWELPDGMMSSVNDAPGAASIMSLFV